MMKKIVILMVLVLGLVGCNKKEATSEKFPATSPNEGELSVWVRNPAEMPALEKFNAKMKAEGRNVSVKINYITAEDFIPAFASALSANQTVDLAMIDLVQVPALSQQKMFFDLTDLYNSLEFKDQLNPMMTKLGFYDNKVYAIPNNIEGSALLYNKKIFAEAGITKFPTNYDELRTTLKQITSKTDKFGYVFSGAVPGGLIFTLMPWIWANGGSWVSEDGKTAQFNTPATVEFMNFLMELMADGSIPEGVASYSWDDYQNAFQQGRVALIGSGSFWIEGLKKAGIDFEVVPFFNKDGTKISSFTGGDLMTIPRTSKYPHLAWELAQYILSEEVQVEEYAKSGSIPVRKDFLDNHYFRAEPRYKVIADATLHGYTPHTTKYLELLTPFKAGIQKILTKQAGVEEALKQANDEMQKILDRPSRP